MNAPTPYNRVPPRSIFEQLPFFIAIIALISLTIRDTVALTDRKESMVKKNASAIPLLQRADQQTAFLELVRLDLQKLAATDPAARKIASDFFPAIVPKPASADAKPPAPPAAK